MQQNGYIPDTANAIAHYFNKASLPSQQETLGQIVMDILNEGRNLNLILLNGYGTFVAVLICYPGRLEVASEPEEENHYQTLIGLLFEHQ